jgi:hypothetical protein
MATSFGVLQSDTNPSVDLSSTFSAFDNAWLDTGGAVADPTNTADLGGTADISTPATASENNPETAAGGTNWATTFNNLINAGFASYQLAQQPAGTRRTITSTVGGTRVTSGFQNPFSGLSTVQQSQLTSIAVIAVIALIGLFVYKSLTRGGG